MAAEIKTTKTHVQTARIPAQDHKIRSSAAWVGRFSLHFLEMMLAMMVGMPFFFMLRNQIPASSLYAAAFVRGTILFDLHLQTPNGPTTISARPSDAIALAVPS